MKSSKKKMKQTQSEKVEKKPTPKWFFLVLFLIPVLFFVLLELSLRIFNYGEEIPQWIDARRGKYIINPDGSLTGKTSFAPAGSDGMTLDSRGNVYLTFGKVLIFNSNGEKIGEIELPESPSNLCFGGKDRKTLFITARTSVYTIRMKRRGVE